MRYLCLGCGKVLISDKKLNDSLCPCGNELSRDNKLRVADSDYANLIVLKDDELVGKKQISINQNYGRLLKRMNRGVISRPVPPRTVLNWIVKIEEHLRNIVEVFGTDARLILNSTSAPGEEYEVTVTQLMEDKKEEA